MVLAYDAGEGTLDEVADTFGVGRCTVARMMKLWRAGQSLAPLLHGGGYPATLNEKVLALLQKQVEVQPDATLSELAAYLKGKAKVQVHPSNICRALQRLGLPRKKKPCGSRASRSRPTSFPPSGLWLGSPSLGLHGRNRLSFGLDQSLWRARRGERVGERVPRNQGKAVTLIGRLGLRGLLAPLSVEGAVATLVFDSYIQQVLLAQLRPKDMLLLDNLPVQLSSQVAQSVAAVKAEVLWLPAYSPDFSPIENCWSKVKTLVRGRRPRTPKDLNAALRDALQAVTLDDIDGWFRHCGY